MSEPGSAASTRAAYDAIAADYAAEFGSDLADQPLDRAALAAFAELVSAAGGGAVTDLGCGPGHVTAHLDRVGLDVTGIDLSPGMVAEARRAHPHLVFEVGTMTGLALADGSQAGVVSWYSIVNIPTDDLPVVFAEFARVLAPGGQLLLACQVGDAVRHAPEWLGHTVDLQLYLRPAEQVVALLAEAGFEVHEQVLRRPDGPAESSPRVFLLARAAR
ncbi:MAG: Methyltransferase type 11 [Modestobacter sp.]|nr:Methyltransferase type 11 [Modestobacter sp.]HEV7871099.1 class I SAM-dependent methyltransferase [Modestobacter sp.]